MKRHRGRRRARLDPGDGRATAGPRPVTDEAEVWQALVLGLRDYVRKNGFRSVILAALRRHRLRGGGRHRGRRARGRARCTGCPCPASTPREHSRDDAADLAKRTGLHYRVEPIQPMVDAFLANIAPVRARGGEPAGPGPRRHPDGTVQPGRPPVLTTGNKSELAVGYSTLYGDSVGGFNPIKDVPKTLVWRLAHWRNAEAERRGETAADPGELDHQAAQRRAAPGPARHRLAARLRRCSTPILAGYIDGDLGRDGLLAAGHDPAHGRPGAADGRPGRVQAAPVRPGTEDLHQGIRPGPPPAHHQPVPGIAMTDSG